MHAKTQVTARSRLAFGMALMVGVAAQAANTNEGGRAAMAPSVPAAGISTFQLAMMDDMEKMGGGAMPAAATMPAGGAMSSGASPGGMPAPMAYPPAAGTMGRARGSMQAQRGMRTCLISESYFL